MVAETFGKRVLEDFQCSYLVRLGLLENKTIEKEWEKRLADFFSKNLSLFSYQSNLTNYCENWLPSLLVQRTMGLSGNVLGYIKKYKYESGGSISCYWLELTQTCCFKDIYSKLWLLKRKGKLLMANKQIQWQPLNFNLCPRMFHLEFDILFCFPYPETRGQFVPPMYCFIENQVEWCQRPSEYVHCPKL